MQQKLIISSKEEQDSTFDSTSILIPLRTPPEGRQGQCLSQNNILLPSPSKPPHPHTHTHICINPPHYTVRVHSLPPPPYCCGLLYSCVLNPSFSPDYKPPRAPIHPSYTVLTLTYSHVLLTLLPRLQGEDLLAKAPFSQFPKAHH